MNNDTSRIMHERDELLHALLQLVVTISDMANKPDADIAICHKHYTHAVKLIEYHAKNVTDLMQ